MAHRSNQAVASQEQPASQPPGDPPQARRFLIGWTTALAALAISLLAVLATLWFLRLSIASFFVGAALAERGADADFEIINLQLDHAVLENVRFGSETSPDAAIPRVEARWRWAGLSPQLTGIFVYSPRLRLRVDPAGRVSAGALDHLGGAPGRRRASIPAIALVIQDGRMLVEAPFGAFEGEFHASGTLGHDFSAVARIPQTTRRTPTHALDRGAAELVVVSRNNTIAGRLIVNAQRLDWADADFNGVGVRIMARAPLDLARYDAEATWRIARLDAPEISAQGVTGSAGLEAIALESSLDPETWQTNARLIAAQLTLASNHIQNARVEARADGREARGEGHWNISGARFEGLSLISERPSAEGAFTLDLRGDESFTGEARVTLAQTQLSARAQERLRATFPDLPTAPVGPTFAQAENALDRAADRFDLTAPLTIQVTEDATRLLLQGAIEARAASGARLLLTPLRDDAPALSMQWPGAAAHGAISIELSGGGAPTATLLLDTLDWSPDAPFEADGTLTLANWRAQGASIAADELDVGISISLSGVGRIDVRGPARVTGPLGEGEVRDLVASLDLSVSWNPGWRVAPNGCLPMQLGGLDAAGLSFGNGNFSLCPLGGALIAADAQRNLSGGFSIQSLGLNGRMGGGPEAQPARVSAGNVTGRFQGRTGDVTLAIAADAPRLQIEMAEDRTLAIAVQRATANAHMANDTWRIDGAFEQGALTDPTLPGAVTTIAGRWSAAPEEDMPVIRVTAGEALLTANRPASADERTLFNPMRLAEVDAIVRDGAIDANGLIVLQEGGQQLASFTAHHDVDEGAGAARITAPTLTFSETLQPYHLSERTRGVVENVRGPASAGADVVWTREALTATGTLRAEGLSLATATMPVIQDVRGEVNFDDLFLMTTPPGQVVQVGLLNPGLAVHDGRVQFQLLADQSVSIERADFSFAGGVLTMSPTRVRLGEDETRIVLNLRDVDADNLMANLNIPDLAATGRIEGTFPLLLTRRTAFIEHGVLRSLPGGGTIAYTGNAGADAAGPARIAFDALRSFAYDNLELTLDGDISGEVVSSIAFSGQNTGEPVDLGELAPIPGVGRVTVRGVPFDFNVRVTAPFRRLAQTAASITDPGIIINRANGEEDAAKGGAEEREPVDLEPPGTR